MLGPLERWRRHVRHACDEGSASIASYVVAAAVFLLGSSYMLHFVIEPPGSVTTGLQHLDLRGAAEEAIELLVGTSGYPVAWDQDTVSIEAMKRLGLVEKGQTLRLDADKFDALARGKLAIASSGNGGVDYAEAKTALGLSGYEFHIRAYPLVEIDSDDYGLADFGDFRVAYVGDFDATGASTPHATEERAALAGLNVDFIDSHYADTLNPGDVYNDKSADLRAGLLPNIGALVQQTVIAQGSGEEHDFYRVPPSTYAALAATATPTTALGLSSDGMTLGYTKNREIRALVAKADLSTATSAKLSWSEWVDTDRGNGSFDCQDYGFVEVSGDNGATWTRLTDTDALRSDDCFSVSPAITPHGAAFVPRTVDDITALCAACKLNPAVLIAFHWVADNDNSIGYGWLIDNVVLDNGAVPTPTTFVRKTFQAPEYDMVIIGSAVDNSAFTPNDVKEAVRDYVDKYGGRIMITGPATNVQWLDRLFNAGIAGASGGVSTPDTTHPLLTLPNPLDYTSYQRGNVWTFGGDDADLFHAIISQPSNGAHVLSVSRQGAWGSGGTNEGSVILSAYLPHEMSAEESRRFFANGISYGKFHHLYLEAGPAVPTREAVASATRVATMNMYRTGEPNYIEMAFVLYVWPGTSAEQTFSQSTVPATAPLKVKATAGAGEVALQWEHPLSDGSATRQEFQVWRGTSPDTTADTGIRVGTPAPPAAPPASYAYTDTGLQNGRTYYYTIVLETGNAVLGAPSDVVSATPVGLPGAPQDVQASTDQAGKVTVTWDALAFPNTGGGTIFGYRVYGTQPGDPNTFSLLSELGNVTTFVHSVDHDDTIWYMVEAYNARGWGPASDPPVSGSAIMPIGPPTLDVQRGALAGEILLTWVAPDTTGHTLAGYRILRSTTEHGEYTELTYLNNALQVSYTDTGLGAGTTRWYKVQGVTNYGDGQLSLPDGATTHAVPTAVTNLDGTQLLGVVTLTWTPPASDLPVTSYEVWRGGSSNTATMSILKTVAAGPTTDTPPNGAYWYAVKAVSAAGTGGFSNVDGPF